MLYFFTGTDTEKLRSQMNAAVDKESKGMQIIRVSDASDRADVRAVLQGRGMFDEPRIVIFNNVLLSAESGELLTAQLPHISKSEEIFFMIEDDVDAATRKYIEKYAEKTIKLDAPKKTRDNTIFSIGNALQQRKKKDLWVAYQRELKKGAAPEAIHGILFWAAKQQLLKQGTPASRLLVSTLAVLPHEARRGGFDLEYALEHFILSMN